MINITAENNISIISFTTDKINALNVEFIKSPLIQLIEEQHNRVLIDFTGINYIDSTGFAMLLQVRRTARVNYSTLKLCGMSEQIAALFKTLNLEHTFDICPDIETGITKF